MKTILLHVSTTRVHEDDRNFKHIRTATHPKTTELQKNLLFGVFMLWSWCVEMMCHTYYVKILQTQKCSPRQWLIGPRRTLKNKTPHYLKCSKGICYADKVTSAISSDHKNSLEKFDEYVSKRKYSIQTKPENYDT